MTQSLSKAVRTSISEVLETMCFTSLEIKDQPEPDFLPGLVSGAARVCRLDFTGPTSGSFFFLAPQAPLTVITADFMGIEPGDLDDAHLDGTLKEITNMIAGSALSHFDASAVFDLAIPQLLPPGDAAVLDLAESMRALVFRLDTMDGVLGLKLVHDKENENHGK